MASPVLGSAAPAAASTALSGAFRGRPPPATAPGPEPRGRRPPAGAGAGAARSSCPAASCPRFCELKAVRGGKPLVLEQPRSVCTRSRIVCFSVKMLPLIIRPYLCCHIFTLSLQKKENAGQADRSGAALDVNVWESHAWPDSTRQSSNPHAGFFSEEIRK